MFKTFSFGIISVRQVPTFPIFFFYFIYLFCISNPTLITDGIFTHHLFNTAALSLWQAGCEPRVAWKHMWDEIGDK